MTGKFFCIATATLLSGGEISAQETADMCSSGSRTEQVQCMQEQHRINVQEKQFSEQRKIIRDWLRKNGLNPDAEDAEIELKVAYRKGELFAVILNRCGIQFSEPKQAMELAECLETETEVERRLGNELN